MMRETGGEGVIININSLAGERVPFIPGFSVYPASKRAIAALAQTLRHELTGTQIRVTVLAIIIFFNKLYSKLNYFQMRRNDGKLF